MALLSTVWVGDSKSFWSVRSGESGLVHDRAIADAAGIVEWVSALPGKRGAVKRVAVLHRFDGFLVFFLHSFLLTLFA